MSIDIPSTEVRRRVQRPSIQVERPKAVLDPIRAGRIVETSPAVLYKHLTPGVPHRPATKPGKIMAALGATFSHSLHQGHHALSVDRGHVQLGYISFSYTAKQSRYADLNEVFIAPHSRRKGVASALYTEAAQILRADGCRMIGGEVLSQAVMNLRLKQFGPFDLICDDQREMTEKEARAILPPAPPDEMANNCRKVFVRNRL